ncbi:hypothetical protein VPH35_041325 [Triticum aestivum]|uniref:Uncharacterized protein n=1 Tax=Aegilops tauschii subsp. strangulata TaxID=200361 RepID=A0A453DI92_AEGTS
MLLTHARFVFLPHTCRRQALDLAATSSALARLMGIGWSMHAGDGGSPRLPSSPGRTRHPTTSSIANHQHPSGGFAFYPLPHMNDLLPATMTRTGELSSPSWAPSCWPPLRRISSRGPGTSCSTGLVHEEALVVAAGGLELGGSLADEGGLD